GATTIAGRNQAVAPNVVSPNNIHPLQSANDQARSCGTWIDETSDGMSRSEPNILITKSREGSAQVSARILTDAPQAPKPAAVLSQSSTAVLGSPTTTRTQHFSDNERTSEKAPA